MADFLLDTSVFIAAEAGRPIGQLPAGHARISVITLAELRLGVLRAHEEIRALRQATWERA